MADDQTPGAPEESERPAEQPADVTDTGVQRALGERRRRRVAERAGQVDLDDTMSSWPVAEPPTEPRPVVRPARPTLPGVATAPALPPPGAVVVGALLEARRRSGDVERPLGARRARRAQDAATGSPAGSTVDEARASGSAAPRTAPVVGSRPVVGSSPVVAAGPVAAGPASPAPGPGDLPAPTPTPVDRDAAGGPGRREGPPNRLGPRLRRAIDRLPGTPRQQLLVAVGTALLLVLVVVLALVLGSAGDDSTVVQPVTDAPAQQTLAVALGDAGSVQVAAVVGVDSARAATLLLPANLVLTVADAGAVPLGQAAALGPLALQRGLEDTLGLRVDDTLVLSPAALAEAVDAVGGVVVDVAAEVVTDSAVVAAGDDQRLTGAQAAAYALVQLPGEPVEARLARFGAVLSALLAAMPDEAAAAADVLVEAGVETGPTVDLASVAGLAAAAADRASAGGAEAVVLETREVSAGGGTALRGVDREILEALAASRFAGATLPTAAAGQVQVFVRNGVGTPGLVGLARDELVAAGLRFVGGGNAQSFDQAETAVLVASQDATARAQGRAVAQALGLGEDSLQVNPETLVDTDVVVLLGEDFAQRVGAGTPAGGSPEPSASP